MFTMIEIREIMWVYCSKLKLWDHPLTHISQAMVYSLCIKVRASFGYSMNGQTLASRLSRQPTAIHMHWNSNQDTIASSNEQALVNRPLNISNQTLTLIIEEQLLLGLNSHIDSHDSAFSRWRQVANSHQIKSQGRMTYSDEVQLQHLELQLIKTCQKTNKTMEQGSQISKLA